MSSSSSSLGRVRPRVLREPAEVGDAAVLALDLAPGGLKRLDPTRIDDAVADGHAAGYAAGFAAGEAAGLAAVQAAQVDLVAAFRQRLEAVLLAAEDAVTEGLSGLSAVADASAKVTTGAAFAIVEALVARELAVATAPGRDAVARALSLAPEGVELTLRLNPDDAEAFGVDDRPAGRTVTVVPDPAVPVGDCVADAGWTRVDARIGTALERVRAVLEGAGMTAIIPAPSSMDRGVIERARAAARPRCLGQVTRVLGLHLEIAGLDAAVGDEVVVASPRGDLATQVIAVHDDSLVCMPYGDTAGLRAGSPAHSTGTPPMVGVGPGLLGRVLDGLGRPLDGRPLPAGLQTVTVSGTPPHPLQRTRIDTALPLGVRALDTLVPCGRGQRLGIFAGSGVGKSSLLSMIARGTEADVSVLALVGERGREVREFLEHDLGPEGLARSVVVVATSDEAPLVRLQAAFTATRIAEQFRDEGAHVVLMMDSLTRFAMAQREVGLSAGEPPATRGYPPSVFALLPRLLERAGAGATGSITGLYTVLVEGDDLQDPVGDAARSILDGHVVLSRRLATAGHFPTIDVLDSISRCVPTITTRVQRTAATELRRLLAAHRDAKDLIDIGAYVPGSNALVDRAVALEEPIRSFLTQDLEEIAAATDAWAGLHALTGTHPEGVV